MHSCAVCVTIFSTGSGFRPVSNFTKLQALTQAACSYVLLTILVIVLFPDPWYGTYTHERGGYGEYSRTSLIRAVRDQGVPIT